MMRNCGCESLSPWNSHATWDVLQACVNVTLEGLLENGGARRDSASTPEFEEDPSGFFSSSFPFYSSGSSASG